jgi:hypothetical protein
MSRAIYSRVSTVEVEVQGHEKASAEKLCLKILSSPVTQITARQ